MKARALFLFPCPLLLAACATTGTPSNKLAMADIANASGQPAGKATITSMQDRLTLSLTLTGLPAGEHGMHLHATGRCEGPAFTSAGSHLNPLGRKHGLHNPAGAHLGDLPNLVVAPDGTARADVPLSGSAAELAPMLLDGDGTAIVIHAGPDDYQTDPTGNSGGRIACGAFTAAK